MALEPAKLSDFTMAGALGSGTTARVYEAVHTVTGRPVAIKVMEQSSSSSEMRERFAREALLLSGVESRHVSKILGFGFDKGQPFLVLERLRGETLDAKLRRDGPVPAPIAVRWIEQLIVGVRDCHDAKIIHRDIKPSNIFLHHDGFDESVKLIDFGVARLREIAGDSGLTSTNHLIGSMGYMAPEQFKSAKSVGYPADLYAVGVVIFRALTGRLPFVSRSIDTIIKLKSEQSAPTVSSMGATSNSVLDWFVQKALLREPEGRFQSAREMLEQWWNVVASLDEEGRTDIMGGMGRVDESYVAAMPRPPTAFPPTSPHHDQRQGHGQGATTLDGPYEAPPANDDPNGAHSFESARGYESGGSESEQTIRRPRAPLPLPSSHGQLGPRPAVAGARSPSSRPQSSDRTIREEAPHTEPSDLLGRDTQGIGHYQTTNIVDAEDGQTGGTGGDETTAMNRLPDEDPFDLPTRNDPNLRKLVERELELQRARKRGQ
jgi:serine/threonine protein kinase